jgi:NTE family protein
MNPKIAITCQGGGSQTAFTAGVFKALFENNVQDYWFQASLCWRVKLEKEVGRKK